MTIAKERGIRNIAFPSISTGIYHYPVEQAAAVAIGAVREFMDKNPGAFDIVEWVLFDQDTYNAYERALSVVEDAQ